MAYYGNYSSHIGYCSYCRRKVYWYWDPRGYWAPPFESWVIGTAPRGDWVHHRCR
jgi:hypothetical protein